MSPLRSRTGGAVDAKAIASVMLSPPLAIVVPA